MESDAPSLSEPWKTARRVAFGLAVLAGLLLVLPEISVYLSTPQGDPAGRGLESALNAFALGVMATAQVALVGFCAGLVVPVGGARLARWVARFITGFSWVGPAVVVGAVESYAQSQGMFSWDLGWYRVDVLWLWWAGGLGSWGVAMGGSRSWGSLVGSALLFSLVVLMPLVFAATAQ